MSHQCDTEISSTDEGESLSEFRRDFWQMVEADQVKPPTAQEAVLPRDQYPGRSGLRHGGSSGGKK